MIKKTDYKYFIRGKYNKPHTEILVHYHLGIISICYRCILTPDNLKKISNKIQSIKKKIYGVKNFKIQFIENNTIQN